MEKVIFYERSMKEIQERYDFIKGLIVQGDRKIALDLYHNVLSCLNFMKNIGLIDFEEYNELVAQHHDNFDILFGI